MIGIIGGTGLEQLVTSTSDSADAQVKTVTTPYGETSAGIQQHELNAVSVAFLSRHGEHRVAPHKVNYRANIWALKEQGVRYLLAVNVVGGINDHCQPHTLVIPNQIIDYTWGRAHTFFDEPPVEHIDFTQPYSETLRNCLITAVKETHADSLNEGCYGATQGPRLESAAEIQRLKRDGCDVVGMTGMPEAALAKELGMEYASLCLVVNRAAGLDVPIELPEIMKVLEQGMIDVRQVLQVAMPYVAALE